MARALIILLILFSLVPGLRATETFPMELFLVLEKHYVWKVDASTYWVRVQRCDDLQNPEWQTILRHGEKLPYHYVMTPRTGDKAFWRVVPALRYLDKGDLDKGSSKRYLDKSN